MIYRIVRPEPTKDEDRMKIVESDEVGSIFAATDHKSDWIPRKPFRYHGNVSSRHMFTQVAACGGLGPSAAMHSKELQRPTKLED